MIAFAMEFDEPMVFSMGGLFFYGMQLAPLNLANFISDSYSS